MFLSDQKILEQVNELVDGAETQRCERANYFSQLWRRYYAKTSIQADSSGVKRKPWLGCSNIGYPVEAIIIEALIPRFIRVATSQSPIIQVTKKMGSNIDDPAILAKKVLDELKNDNQNISQVMDLASQIAKNPTLKKKLQNELISKYREEGNKISNLLNFQALSDEWGFDMALEKEIAYRITCVEGCCIEKAIWDEKNIKKVKVIKTLANKKGDFLLKQRDENGEVEVDANGTEIPVDVGDNKLEDILSTFSEEEIAILDIKDFKIVTHHLKISEIVKDRPLLIPYSLENFNIPDIDNILNEDPDDWPWIEHVYSKTLDEIIGNVGKNEEEFELKYNEETVDKLREKLSSKLKEEQTLDLNSDIVIREFHGKIDIDGDGELEDVEVHIGDDEYVLGWTFSRFSRKPFFNNQIIPNPNKAHRGISVVEFIWSIRRWLDYIINLLNDHATISVSPPILFGKGNGVNLKEAKWGIGKFWKAEDINQVREVQITRQDINAQNIMQVLLGIVQKLFGVNDYTLGSESQIASNKTARGISSLIQESNIKFDHLISRLQKVNAKEFQFIHKLNILFLDKDMELKISNGEMPYQYIENDMLAGEFDFKMTGNSINTNERIQQETATFLFNTYMPLYLQQVPFVNDDMIKELIDMVNNAFSFEFDTPSVQEAEQKRVSIQQQAIKQNDIATTTEKIKSLSKNDPDQALLLAQELRNKYPDMEQKIDQTT